MDDSESISSPMETDDPGKQAHVETHQNLWKASQNFIQKKISAAENLPGSREHECADHNKIDLAKTDGSYATPDAIVIPQFQQNEKQKEIYAQVLEDYFENNLTETEIASKYNLTQYKVSRIITRKAKFDNIGQSGPKTALSNFAEVLLGLGIHKLVREGIELSYIDISEYARVLWRAENPRCSKLPPSFGKDWRKGFNRRHKGLPLKRKTIRPKEKRRFDASKRPNVNNALQGLKHIIKGKISSKRVYTYDEVDLSANNKTAGHKGVTVGNVPPLHVAPNDTPHVTSCIFLGLHGIVMSHSIVVASLTAPPGYNGLREKLTRGVVVRNASGGVTTVVRRN